MISQENKTKKIIIAVLILWCVWISKADSDKSVNVKLGFDLDATDEEASAVQNKKSDDSDSSEETAKLRKRVPESISKEDVSSSDDRDNASDGDRLSTKGLRIDEYEPERNVQSHKYKDSSSE